MRLCILTRTSCIYQPISECWFKITQSARTKKQFSDIFKLSWKWFWVWIFHEKLRVCLLISENNDILPSPFVVHQMHILKSLWISIFSRTLDRSSDLIDHKPSVLDLQHSYTRAHNSFSHCKLSQWLSFNRQTSLHSLRFSDIPWATKQKWGGKTTEQSICSQITKSNMVVTSRIQNLFAGRYFPSTR